MNPASVEKITLYRADRQFRTTVIGALSIIAADVRRYRALIWQYAKRDFVLSYRGSALGVLWKFANPIVPLSVYVVLQKMGFLAGATSMPKVVYVVIGISFWQLWLGLLNKTATCLSSYRAIFRKVRIPFIVGYAASLGEIAFDLAVRLLVVVPLLYWSGHGLNARWLALPLLLTPLLLSAFGIGVLVSLPGAFMQDVKSVIDVVTRYLVFVSAVIFPIPPDSGLWEVFRFNPLYHFVEEGRGFLILGRIEDPTAYGICVLIAIAIFLFGLRTLIRVESIVRGYL